MPEQQPAEHASKLLAPIMSEAEVYFWGVGIHVDKHGFLHVEQAIDHLFASR